MNLGTWRIAIIVALVVVGVAVLANGFDDDGTAVAAPSGSPSPTTDDGGDDGDGQTVSPSPDPSDEPTETPAPNETGVAVKVFNGTSVPGLAALVQDEIVAAGNDEPEEPANAPVVPVTKTTVYFRGGPQADQNQADAVFIAETYIEPVVGKVPRVLELSGDLDGEVGDAVTVVVVVGDDYAANFQTADG